MKRKGFVFTIDAFVALVLALFAISAMLFITSVPKSTALSYSKIYSIADDSLNVLSGTKIVSIEKESALNNEESVGNAVGRLISSGKTGDASRLVELTLQPIIPEQFGFSVEYRFGWEYKDGERWIGLYERKRPETRMKTSSVRVYYGTISEGIGQEWCYSEDCPGCGSAPSYIEGESYGPLLMKVSVWA